MYIDEMTNEQLEREGFSDFYLQSEKTRVDDVIRRQVPTGVDLSYFLERSRILGRLLNSGRRDPRLG